MVPAHDRFVYCAPGAVGTMRMDGMAVLLDEPKLAEERFQTAEGRMQNWDEFLALFVPPFQARTAQEWFERAEAMHMTFALVQTVDDLFSCPQLGARGLLRSLPGPDGISLGCPAGRSGSTARRRWTCGPHRASRVATRRPWWPTGSAAQRSGY